MATHFGFEPSTDRGYYFISYNTEDADRVSAICNYLYKAGVKIWYDAGIPHDSNWHGILAEKIDKSEEVIFFITKGIFRKAKERQLKQSEVYPYLEYDMAKFYEKKTLIVVLDEIGRNDLPYELMHWWQEINPSVKQGVLGINTELNEVARRILHELGFKNVYSIEDDIKFAVFNSVVDHPEYGDEREFIHIRQRGDSKWHRSMKLVADR